MVLGSVCCSDSDIQCHHPRHHASRRFLPLSIILDPQITTHSASFHPTWAYRTTPSTRALPLLTHPFDWLDFHHTSLSSSTMSDADTLHNAASSAAPVEQKNDSADLFGGMKKKKKDKKKLDLDLDLDLDEEDNQEDTADAEQSNAAAAEDDELNVSNLASRCSS